MAGTLTSACLHEAVVYSEPIYHISTISTASCSSMLYSPSKQRMGQGSVLSHWLCRRLLRMSNPPSSYDAAHARNAWDTSYMSPPGRMRSPNRAYSRRWRRAIRISWGIHRKTTNSNRGIATSPHPQSDPDKTQESCAVRSSIRRCWRSVRSRW